MREFDPPQRRLASADFTGDFRDERENVNNTLLRTFTWGAVLMASSGIWLLFYSFHRKKKKKAARA